MLKSSNNAALFILNLRFHAFMTINYRAVIDWLFLYALGAIGSIADSKSVRCRFDPCGACL